ncbi:MAG: hypothetical protein H6679_00445 [Epsilonproteobacteria bacterium]|nr:hypothetical protein [Campylobacterota bacterium]
MKRIHSIVLVLTFLLLCPCQGSAFFSFKKTEQENSSHAKLYEKISSYAQNLPYIMQTASSQKKGEMLANIYTFMRSIGNATNPELATLKTVLEHSLGVPQFLEQGQVGTVQQWMTTTNFALRLSSGNTPFINDLKLALEKNEQNFDALTNVCMLGLSIVDTDIASYEKKTSSKKSLAYTLNKTITQLYENRSHKNYQQLQKLFSLAASAQSKNMKLISPGQYNSIEIAYSLAYGAQLEKTDDKLALHHALVEKIDHNTHPQEKKSFISSIDHLFNHRSAYTPTTLKQLHTLCINAAGKELSKKSVFAANDSKILKDMASILACTIALQSPYDSLDDGINAYQKVLTTASNQRAGYERSLVVSLLNNLFSNRGNYTKSELQSLHKFFSTVHNTKNLLASNQQAALALWGNEIRQNARFMEHDYRPEATYIDTLLLHAASTYNVDMYTQALALINEQTPMVEKDRFVEHLNSLVAMHHHTDQTKLKNLLGDLESKKIGHAPFLNVWQQSVLNQWKNIF